jgi:hypothetical protein
MAGTLFFYLGKLQGKFPYGPEFYFSMLLSYCTFIPIINERNPTASKMANKKKVRCKNSRPSTIACHMKKDRYS